MFVWLFSQPIIFLVVFYVRNSMDTPTTASVSIPFHTLSMVVKTLSFILQNVFISNYNNGLSRITCLLYLSGRRYMHVQAWNILDKIYYVSIRLDQFLSSDLTGLPIYKQFLLVFSASVAFVSFLIFPLFRFSYYFSIISDYYNYGETCLLYIYVVLFCFILNEYIDKKYFILLSQKIGNPCERIHFIL